MTSLCILHVMVTLFVHLKSLLQQKTWQMHHPFNGNGGAADVRVTSDTKHLELLLNMIFQCKSLFKPFVSSWLIDFSWLVAPTGVHDGQ